MIHEASVLESMWLMELARLSEAVYLELRLRFIDRFVFPPLYKILSQSKLSRPKLSLYNHGVRAELSECLTLTLQEHLTILDESGVVRVDQAVPAENSGQVEFEYTYGLDGSGKQKNYNQLSKVNYSTENIMSCCFSLIKIIICGNVVWSATDLGVNRPQNVRPLALFDGKENDQLLREFIPGLDKEVREINEKGLVLKAADGVEITATCRKCKMAMADGKMVVRLLQLGGAYCTMCSNTMLQCHEV